MQPSFYLLIFPRRRVFSRTSKITTETQIVTKSTVTSTINTTTKTIKHGVELNVVVDDAVVMTSSSTQYRYYSTIGIDDVFLQKPNHVLPQNYMQNGIVIEDNDKNFSSSSSSSSSFTSWEIVGKIKETPEDFIVREIGENATPMAGLVAGIDECVALSDDDPATKRAKKTINNDEATSSPQLSSNCISKDDTELPISDQKVSSTTDTSTINSPIKAPIDLPPQELITLVLDQVFSTENNHHNQMVSSTKYIIKSLNELQEDALERIKLLKETQNDEAPKSIPVDTAAASHDDKSLIWIPPIPKDFSDWKHPGKLVGLNRGDFHRALRLLFPLLQSESLIRDDDDDDALRMDKGSTTNSLNSSCNNNPGIGTSQKERWVCVTMDNTFHGLISYLFKPEEDLLSLYRFHKKGYIGCDAETTKSSNGSKRRGSFDPTDAQANSSLSDQNNTKVTNPILRLRPDLTKDQRRPIHHLISQKNRDFETKTISDYPLEGGGGGGGTTTTTTAISVQWSSNAFRRNRRKRKLISSSSTFKSTVEPNRNLNTLCVLKKTAIEHLNAIQHVVAACRCKPGDVGLAGIKDMKAVTYQFCTLRHVPPQRVKAMAKSLDRKGVELRLLHHQQVNFFLQNGDLKGNRFEIWVRSLQRIHVQSDPSSMELVKEVQIGCTKAHVESMVERIRAHGFVNYFGEQRVGIPGHSSDVGVRSPDIGRAMLQNNYSEAVDLIMTGRSISYYRDEKVNPDVIKVRTTWKSSGGDPVATLKSFPKRGDILSREKTILKGLKRYGKGEPLLALKCLPHSVRRFWINAYQSYIWNLMASARLKKHGTNVVIGDLFLETRSSKPDEIKIVTSDLLHSISLKQIILPLPGFGVQYPQNEIGKQYRELLEQDHISFDKQMPDEGTAKGAYRYLLAEPENLAVEFAQGSGHDDCVGSMKLTFDLPAGSYATMLLRELMITTVVRD